MMLRLSPALVVSVGFVLSLLTSSGRQEPRFTDAEVQVLSKSLAEWRKAESQPVKNEKERDSARKEIEKTKIAFKDVLSKVKEAHKDVDVAALVDSWSNVFVAAAATEKSGSAEGKGRVKNQIVKYVYKGKDYQLEYGIYIPEKYDGKKTWPMVICFHDDSETNGEKYLNEVWAKSDKEIRDQFIFIAPTVEKNVGAADKADRVRIAWFDANHLRIVSRALNEAIDNFNVDTNRIFLDGVGVGAQTAIELAASFPQKFAAVIARSATPRNLQKLSNLKNLTPIRFIDRESGVFATEDGRKILESIEALKKEHTLNIEIMKRPDHADKNRARQALGSQKSDPCVDATAEIATFLKATVRNHYPASFHFACYDIRRFKEAAWAIIEKGEADEQSSTVAILDATIDRKTNTVTFTSSNVETFRFYLNDRLFDLSQPVKIILNGKDHVERKVDRDLDFMLEQNKRSPLDPTLVVVSEIQIAVPSEEQPPPGTAPGKEGEATPGGEKKG